jgi:hypothetical protein
MLLVHKESNSMKDLLIKNIISGFVFIFFTAGICSAQTTLYFPQFADGRDAGATSAWGTLIFVTNLATAGTPAANVTIAVTQDNGTTMNITLSDAINGGIANSFQLAGGQTKLVASPSNDHPLTPLNNGFVTVTSSLPVSAGLVFVEYICLANDGCGDPISQAGVPAATPLTLQGTGVVRVSNVQGAVGTEPAVAVANPGTGTATIAFQLVDNNGTTIGSPVTRTLAAKNHTAFFVSQLFPSIPSGYFIGTLRMTSDIPIVTTALTFAGSLFATIPVFPLP